eukprot:10564647-Ditylum_brightwellii.AAC.1
MGPNEIRSTRSATSSCGTSHPPSARILVLASLFGTHVEIKDEDFIQIKDEDFMQTLDITTEDVETI